MPRAFQVRVQVTEKFGVSNQAWVTKGRQQRSAEFQSSRHSASPEFSVQNAVAWGVVRGERLPPC